jgi:hypothetical protein
MPLLNLIELFQGISFLLLPIGKLKLRTPRHESRWSVVPLVQISAVHFRRPQSMPVMRGHWRRFVQRQGIRIDGSLGDAAHKL